jgi:hypothetical protein
MSINLPLMATNTTYPTGGVRMGLNSPKQTSVYPCSLLDIDLLVGGTPGTSPVYQVEVMTRNGNWVPAKGLLLTAAGQISGQAYGCAARLNANNGTTPGTGNNTPRYFLGVTSRHRTSYGQYRRA